MLTDLSSDDASISLFISVTTQVFHSVLEYGQSATLFRYDNF